LIRHARWRRAAAAPVFPLPVAMIEPSFGTLLVPFVGAAALLTACVFAAIGAAIAVPAITGCADEKHRLALLAEAHSLPENCCVPCRRHASSLAGLDNGTRFVAG
jgi:hypothetical protein